MGSCSKNFKPASFDGISILEGATNTYAFCVDVWCKQKRCFVSTHATPHGLLRRSVLLSNGQSRLIYFAFVAAFVFTNEGVVVGLPWTHFNRSATTFLRHAAIADSVVDHFDHQLALCFE